MVIDVYDAVPVNPKEFHSHHVLLTNVTDRLLEELRTFPLELIKGVFIENSLLTGVVFEKIHRGELFVHQCINVIHREQPFDWGHF